MIKLRKKLLSAALAAAIAVSATQVPAWSEDEPAATTEEVSAETETAEEEVEMSTKEAAFAAMTLMAETDKLALYVNEDDYDPCVLPSASEILQTIFPQIPYQIQKLPQA